MIFSRRDIDLLKLLRWCQYIRWGDLCAVFSEAEIKNLMCVGYISVYKKSDVLQLSAAGRAFVHSLLGGNCPNSKQSYHQSAMQRRLRVSKIVLTAYKAGFDVFAQKPGGEIAQPALCLTSVMRINGKNPWGNARTAAIINYGKLVCSAHYVCSGIGNVMVEDETAGLYNQTANLEFEKRGFIFAGESYQSVIEELNSVTEDNVFKLIGYGDMYRESILPVYLLSCDDIGALQLRIMSVPEYRQWISRMVLSDKYKEADGEVEEWDAMYDRKPFVVAVDMDLRRIDSAIKIAEERGYNQVTVIGFKTQAETVLYPRYRDTGRARVFTFTEEAEKDLMTTLGIGEIKQKPYVTEKGDVFDAPLIRTR